MSPHEEVSLENFAIGATAMMSKTKAQRSDGTERCPPLQRQDFRAKRAAVDGDADVTGQEICGSDRTQ